MEPDEARRITRLIEANHSRQEALRAQLERLSALLDEQTRAQGTLEATAMQTNKRTMIPLGSGVQIPVAIEEGALPVICLLYTSPSPRDVEESRMPSSA